MTEAITAERIVALLADKHKTDVLVQECNLGYVRASAWKRGQ